MWRAPDTLPQLTEREIHVWAIPLTGTEFQFAALHATLAAHERTQAARFHFDRHRRRFVFGRGRMRHLLGAYLKRDPRDLTFQYDGLGKPSLPRGCSEAECCFNFSNSGDLALLAVGCNVPLGVDLERVRQLSDMPALARRFFSFEESDAILSIADAAERLNAFFRCWTRKEAYLKAVGKGLTFPLDQVVVNIDADSDPRILRIGPAGAGEAANWQLTHLDPPSGYQGALACRRLGDRVACWWWREFGCS
jgi:4'-phosphopantetheinyl transferase